MHLSELGNVTGNFNCLIWYVPRARLLLLRFPFILKKRQHALFHTAFANTFYGPVLIHKFNIRFPPADTHAHEELPWRAPIINFAPDPNLSACTWTPFRPTLHWLVSDFTKQSETAIRISCCLWSRGTYISAACAPHLESADQIYLAPKQMVTILITLCAGSWKSRLRAIYHFGKVELYRATP